MALNLESLLKPVSDDNPVGEDLSYDPERHEIEQAFDTGEYGASVSESEIDWRKTVKLIEQQFARTKDVWLPTYLCRAGARSGNLETIEIGAQALAGLFELYWDKVHPQLDELGLPGRKAPCDSLSSRKDFLTPLEKVVLFAHPRLGSFNGGDLERFRSQAEAAEGYGMFRAALDELGEEPLVAALARLDKIEDGLRRADKVFTIAAAGEPSPNFALTYTSLAGLKQSLAAFVSTPAEADAEVSDAVAEGQAGGGAPAPKVQKIAGAVESRDDVIRALDAIADYYRKREPSHPVQLLLQRAKIWIGLDFMELLADIAPGSLSDAKHILNKRDEG